MAIEKIKDLRELRRKDAEQVDSSLEKALQEQSGTNYPFLALGWIDLREKGTRQQD